jgi:hypothetical protein
MRSLQRSRLARAVVAFLVSASLSLLAWRAGAAVTLALLLTLLLIVTFALLTAAPDFIAYQRKHHWRWWWRASDDEGPFWPGTRVPRHPR